MEAVFATPFELSQELLFVELPVVIGIAESIQAPGSLLFVLEEVEGVNAVHAPLNFGAEFFDFGFHLIDRNSIKTAVLVPGDQSALRIHCHRDPGSLLALEQCRASRPPEESPLCLRLVGKLRGRTIENPVP